MSYIVELYHKYHNQASVGSLGQAFNIIDNWLNGDDFDPSRDYYDIHKGNNTSELDGLVSWDGVGGYWANVAKSNNISSSKKQRVMRLKGLYNKRFLSASFKPMTIFAAKRLKAASK